MAVASKIQWTDATWNPTAGCSVISPGCTRCYAMRDAWRLAHNPNPKIQAKYAATVRKVNGKPVWTGRVNLDKEALLAPLRWRKPRRVFVDSMSDLFHENVPDEWIDRVFAVMALTRRQTYQVLTKRPERMQTHFAHLRERERAVYGALLDLAIPRNLGRPIGCLLPLRNVWLGVSVEDRRQLYRIDDLRATPAAIRFLSIEPLLEDLGEIDLTGVDWVIVGGESGPDARPFDIAWARSLRDLCQAAGVAFFMKQLGSRPFDGARECPCADGHGGDPGEWPEDLRVQAFPFIPSIPSIPSIRVNPTSPRCDSDD